MATEPVLVTTDGRGRCNLSKVGVDRPGRYLVNQQPDGTLILTPARLESTRPILNT